MNFLRMADLDLGGKRVFIRADLNVPQDDSGGITDDTRIRASLGAVRLALAQGAAVMVTSHLGRPTEGHMTPADSLRPVAERLSELLERPVPLVEHWLDGVAVAPGEVVLLENCRVNPGEKNNDPVLAQTMARLCDVYVNDAFGTAHRAEATTVGIAQFAPVACAGPLLAAELDALGRVLDEPRRPLVAIVAGSKVSTKLTLLRTLGARVDQLVVGGGIANTFLAAAGQPIGKSLSEPALVGEARAVMEMLGARGAAVPLPVDVVVSDELSPRAHAKTVAAGAVAADEMILDIGPDSARQLGEVIAAAGTVVWNGPVGVFEIPAFAAGTEAVARAIAASAAFSIAGGGDTLAAIAKFGIEKDVGYISTGGGAFLEFLEGKTLPAVQALEARAHAAAPGT